ncbi:MAG: hypothetical protein ABSC19_08740 [Syntrophorhabdales bacterium]
MPLGLPAGSAVPSRRFRPSSPGWRLSLVGHLPYLARLSAMLPCDDPERAVVNFRMAGMVCMRKTGADRGVESESSIRTSCPDGSGTYPTALSVCSTRSSLSVVTR